MTAINNNQQDEPLPYSPVVLLLVDGWGVAPLSEANAIHPEDTPTFNNLIVDYPVALLSVGDKNLNTRYLSLGAGSDLKNEKTNPAAIITRVIANAGLKQVKITETERLAALTYFFNGHSDNKAPNEDWKIISSQTAGDRKKSIEVANKITTELINCLKTEQYHFLAVSLPTLDLVAASGEQKIIKKAIGAVDNNLRKIAAMVLEKNGVLLLTAAAGNIENIKNMATELLDDEITDNPVPLIIIGDSFKGMTIGFSEPLNNDLSLLAPVGNLGDLAPTILDIMNLPKPRGMTGNSLINQEWLNKKTSSE